MSTAEAVHHAENELSQAFHAYENTKLDTPGSARARWNLLKAIRLLIRAEVMDVTQPRDDNGFALWVEPYVPRKNSGWPTRLPEFP